MREHNINKNQDDFIDIWEDRVKAEIVTNGLDYREGDIINIFEYNDKIKDYTQREITAEVVKVVNLYNGKWRIHYKVIS